MSMTKLGRSVSQERLRDHSSAYDLDSLMLEGEDIDSLAAAIRQNSTSDRNNNNNNNNNNSSSNDGARRYSLGASALGGANTRSHQLNGEPVNWRQNRDNNNDGVVQPRNYLLSPTNNDDSNNNNNNGNNSSDSSGSADGDEDADSGFLEGRDYVGDKRLVRDAIPHEHFKTVAVFIFFVLSAWSNWIALALIHDIVGRKPLPDLIFAYVDEQQWALRVGDTMVSICIWSSIITIVFHGHRWIILRRGLFIGAVLYLCRSLSMFSTQLPPGYTDNSKSCRNQVNRSTWSLIMDRFVEQALRIGFQQSYDGYLCGDLLFSGHTLAMTLGASIVHYYTPRRLRPIRYFIWVCALVGMICMIICRTHYTVDVLFGYWMTIGFFTLYHAYCEMSSLKRRQSLFARLFVFRIVASLEKKVPSGKLINWMEWPFARPFTLIRLAKQLSDRHSSMSTLNGGIGGGGRLPTSATQSSFLPSIDNSSSSPRSNGFISNNNRYRDLV